MALVTMATFPESTPSTYNLTFCTASVGADPTTLKLAAFNCTACTPTTVDWVQKAYCMVPAFTLAVPEGPPTAVFAELNETVANTDPEAKNMVLPMTFTLLPLYCVNATAIFWPAVLADEDTSALTET